MQTSAPPSGYVCLRIKVWVIKKYLHFLALSVLLFTTTVANAQLKDSVFSYIVACGIKHPEIVMQQCLLETGHLRVPYLMHRHNLFAFRVTEAYMTFESWKQSVEYYKRWQDKHYTNPNEDYYVFLKRIKYSESSGYLDVLRKVSIKKG